MFANSPVIYLLRCTTTTMQSSSSYRGFPGIAGIVLDMSLQLHSDVCVLHRLPPHVPHLYCASLFTWSSLFLSLSFLVRGAPNTALIKYFFHTLHMSVRLQRFPCASFATAIPPLLIISLVHFSSVRHRGCSTHSHQYRHLIHLQYPFLSSRC